MHQQLGLFERAEPRFDPRFEKLERRQLAAGAWVDYAPSWVSGHAWLFEVLLRSEAWHTGEQPMYERTVVTPRLMAAWSGEGPAQAIVEGMRRAIELRYGVELARIGLALYRDGRDSVAYHGDRVGRELPETLVATISLGAPRRFLLRPHGGGASIAYNLGWGDLLVMGGSCQRTWQHAIPKVAAAQPRIALMFRPEFSHDQPMLAGRDGQPVRVGS
jgi:alkylated DNA repair dioxygenase AlkB